MHMLIQEIRYHPDWLRWREANWPAAMNFLNAIERDLAWQWPQFLKYKELKRRDPGLEMRIGNGKETACMPEVYSRWCKFLQPEGEMSKGWLKKFVTAHPELWNDGYVWGRQRSELR